MMNVGREGGDIDVGRGVDCDGGSAHAQSSQVRQGGELSGEHCAVLGVIPVSCVADSAGEACDSYLHGALAHDFDDNAGQGGQPVRWCP